MERDDDILLEQMSKKGVDKITGEEENVFTKGALESARTTKTTKLDKLVRLVAILPTSSLGAKSNVSVSVSIQKDQASISSPSIKTPRSSFSNIVNNKDDLPLERGFGQLSLEEDFERQDYAKRKSREVSFEEDNILEEVVQRRGQYVCHHLICRVIKHHFHKCSKRKKSRRDMTRTERNSLRISRR